MKEANFNLSEQQRKDLDKKLNEVLELCQIYHIPFFASVAVKNSDQETEYNNIVYSAQSHAIRLHDDRIRKYMLIANGNFEVVPGREVVPFDPFGVIKNE